MGEEKYSVAFAEVARSALLEVFGSTTSDLIIKLIASMNNVSEDAVLNEPEVLYRGLRHFFGSGVQAMKNMIANRLAMEPEARDIENENVLPETQRTKPLIIQAWQNLRLRSRTFEDQRATHAQ